MKNFEDYTKFKSSSKRVWIVKDTKGYRRTDDSQNFEKCDVSKHYYHSFQSNKIRNSFRHYLR